MKFWSMEDLMSWQPEKFESYVGDNDTGLLVPGGRMIMYGRWGTFKSMLTMDMAFSITEGTNWLVYPTTKAKVAILQVEIPQAQMKGRLKTYMDGHYILSMPKELWVASEPFFKLTGGSLTDLTQHLRGMRADILIVDPVYKVLQGDPNKPQDVGEFLDRLDEIVYGTNISIVLVGHIRKKQQDEEGDKVFQTDGSRLHLEYEKVRHSHTELLAHDVVINRSSLSFKPYPCTCPFTRNLENELVGSSYYANWADSMISVQEAVHRRKPKDED